MTPQIINVTIPCPEEGYSPSKYFDGRNCYLASALKDLGYNQVHVLSFGCVEIGRDVYKPAEFFSGGTCRKAFGRGESINLTLIKQDS